MPRSINQGMSSSRCALASSSRPSRSPDTWMSSSATTTTYTAASWDAMTTTDTLYGFPPILGDRARLLILGNAPSVLSLAHRQYYGNPRNAFWPIAGEVFGFDAGAPYDVRTAVLTAHGVAVWDVLRSCRRKGSLDSAIERDSM